MHWVRRGHLFLGLFLLPWAVLYGVTAFLFNHPTAFSDQQTISFDAEALKGTTMEAVPSPPEMAAQVVTALQARELNGVKYTLVRPDKAAFTRDFAFATVKANDQQFSVLVDVHGKGGTIRLQPPTATKVEEAPFAVGSRPGIGKGSPSSKSGGRRGDESGSRSSSGLTLDQSLPERIKAAVPTVLERNGFPTGEVGITSLPDLIFYMDADGKQWKVTYNALTGAVSGRPDGKEEGDGLSIRRFLTRLHLSHGYPLSGGVRWYWAVIVDAMAIVMVFWGISGIFMQWQIRAARRIGLVLLIVSAIAAVALAAGMHEWMAQ